MKAGIAIHGGAGTIEKSSLTPELYNMYTTALNKCIEAGYKVIEQGGSAMDAVSAAVIALENEPVFNAGCGAVFTHGGGHEMDASIMDGSNLMAGGVTCVKNIKNPIILAREVMEKSGFVLLSGAGAEEFARTQNIAFEPDEYFYNEVRYQQYLKIRDSDYMQLDHNVNLKKGTVGAVALDKHGNLAAATSTGGMTNKRYNRIGDTPIIGCGTYANNNTCAISCTGHGEYFIRNVVAYDVSCLMEYKGLSLQEACNIVVNDKLVKLGGEGGLIAIDAAGNIALPFNSEGMYRANQSIGAERVIAVHEL
ncbi:MAG: isoaspartyl peptidase/L-asparaginase [Bacteroidota bacterium]|nr:isoaspartyl peptidase/L-asparaginase [Bacteroidota bacterium]